MNLRVSDLTPWVGERVTFTCHITFHGDVTMPFVYWLRGEGDDKEEIGVNLYLNNQKMLASNRFKLDARQNRDANGNIRSLESIFVIKREFMSLITCFILYLVCMIFIMVVFMLGSCLSCI